MENKSAWIRWLPGLLTFRQYKVTWLVHDVVAGVVLTTMLVPVGIAYAVASGLPGICGLYATIVPLLAYALFGPSRILVLGPNFIAGCCHSWRGFSAIWRRSRSRRGAGRHDGGRFWDRVYSRGRCAARLRHRTFIQTHPVWIHE